MYIFYPVVNPTGPTVTKQVLDFLDSLHTTQPEETTTTTTSTTSTPQIPSTTDEAMATYTIINDTLTLEYQVQPTEDKVRMVQDEPGKMQTKIIYVFVVSVQQKRFLPESEYQVLSGRRGIGIFKLMTFRIKLIAVF